MKPSPRLFHCLKCHIRVLLCSYCDRGQIYCSKACSTAARRKSCQDAEKRYQLTFKGRVHHALRQKRYRLRQKQIVTDQGSPAPTRDALLESVKNQAKEARLNIEPTALRCRFCKQHVSHWVRNGFLRYYGKKPPLKKAYLRPP